MLRGKAAFLGLDPRTQEPTDSAFMAYYVYILANKPHGTVYIGFTNDLSRRVYEQKEEAVAGFTKTYGLKKLVYFEVFEDIDAAMQREKSLKRWNRAWKISLIEEHNPQWRDLYFSLQL